MQSIGVNNPSSVENTATLDSGQWFKEVCESRVGSDFGRTTRLLLRFDTECSDTQDLTHETNQFSLLRCGQLPYQQPAGLPRH